MEEILKELREKANGPCVSIIVPSHRSKPDSLQNHIILENALKQAKETIASSKYAESLDKLSKKMEALHDQINFQETLDGVGLFISPDTAKVVHFPFPVTKKVIVGPHFETRDIVYTINNQIPYYVLTLSTNACHLYRGEAEKLSEIEDEHFPKTFKDEYQHQQPSTPYDVDKSAIIETREKQFFQEVDQLLSEYLEKESLPVVLAGVDKYLGYYGEITKNSNRIIGKVHGNFDRNFEELQQSAWKQIQHHRDLEKEALLQRLEEAVGKHLCVWGMEDVWNEASTGKGDVLLVEKDYMMQGYIQNELFKVNLDGKEELLQKKVNDAVEEVIRFVLSFDGRVVFMDNDQLKSYDRIALLLRYR